MKEHAQKKYGDSIEKALEKYPPEQVGGCYIATRWLCKKHPELQELRLRIKHDESDVSHAVAITPNGLVIDTQVQQFGLIIPLPPKKEWEDCIFTQKEHKQILPRYKVIS